MLFDESDLRVFDSVESREYFQEILQSYYSRNYRAAIVLLYSFVIYDLYIKLQVMANEGDAKAKIKLKTITEMIEDDEKYSRVENEVIQFFKETCALYFDKFDEDIDYLFSCRNKCAHLKVNDNSLYIPSDYQVRMLICSMFDNILSVKAPFIMDLFSVARTDVEIFSSSVSYISIDGVDESILQSLTNKYFNRMTFDSIKKSYKTFIRLLMISDDESCDKNRIGLYVFTYALTSFILKEGYVSLFKEPDIVSLFSRIDSKQVENNYNQYKAIVSLMISYSVIMDSVRVNSDLYEYICRKVFSDPRKITLYRTFYPRDELSIYEYFLNNKNFHKPLYTEELYDALFESDGFNIDEFLEIMVTAIPSFNGFDAADSFMRVLINHVDELSADTLMKLMGVYSSNNQCVKRTRHKSDMEQLKPYLELEDEDKKDIEEILDNSDDESAEMPFDL